jgi:(1->4)-alpha-D-glucan 1-alpha-D-glucosylmutase
MPALWQRTVTEWRQLTAVHRTAVDRRWAPDANDEYLFYQTLVASWPAEDPGAPIPTEAAPEFVARVRAYMQKAIREAKLHTSWINQHAAYEDAVSRFVDTALTGSAGHAFLSVSLPFIRRIAHAGMVNSLAQVVLKVASPGVPDFYQGTETWQLDMADPDNRRPVDFGGRHAMLCELMPWVRRIEALADSTTDVPSGDIAQYVGQLLAAWPDARIKMFVTACALRLRRRESPVFIDGRYLALRTEGPESAHLVTFARHHGAKLVVAAVPRLTSDKQLASSASQSAESVWDGTRLFLPPGTSGIRHLFTGERIVADATGEYVQAADLFRRCPVALLTADNAETNP